MCFSASASFSAGVAVAAAGIVSVKRIRSREQIMFAIIPLIFAVQQVMEGWVWMTFNHVEYEASRHIPAAVFLFFAQVVWPVWVPFSLFRIESDARLRAALRVLCLCSVILAPFQIYRLLMQPAVVSITNHHIHYKLDSSIVQLGWILNVFYFLTTIVPPFLSTRRPVLILGAFNFLALVVTWFSFRPNVVSVWCFFAALISVQVIQTMGDMNREKRLT
jgi:hypothetical protein